MFHTRVNRKEAIDFSLQGKNKKQKHLTTDLLRHWVCRGKKALPWMSVAFMQFTNEEVTSAVHQGVAAGLQTNSRRKEKTFL